jgi:hypothetical protein
VLRREEKFFVNATGSGRFLPRLGWQVTICH